jgi:Spy/CpxP family protein refolding chaperone
MRRLLAVTVLAGALVTGILQAQTPKAGDDPLARLLFEPELVLKHAQELGLQPAQRATIITAIKDAQGDILDLQLQMSERAQELIKSVEGPRIDEGAALAQVDKVLGLERDIKRKQMQLLIRIKNALTREQQDRLQEWKKTGEKEEL